MLSHRNGPMRNCARTFFIPRMMNSKWISRMLSDGSLITVAHKCFSVLRNFSHHTPTRLLHYSLAAQSQKSIHFQLERSAPLHNILHRDTQKALLHNTAHWVVTIFLRRYLLNFPLSNTSRFTFTLKTARAKAKHSLKNQSALFRMASRTGTN